MTYIDTHIDIDAPPAAVRAVVLDFDRMAEWHTAFLKVMRPLPPSKGAPAPAPIDMPAGGPMHLCFLVAGTGTTVSIVENSEKALTWEGGPALIFHGIHSLGFEPLDGGARTRFTNTETYTGLFGMGAGLPGIKGNVVKLYEGYNRDLKKRVESLQAAQPTKTEAAAPATAAA